MSDTATAVLDLKPGWLVRVTEGPKGPIITRIQGSRRKVKPTVVIGVISQVDERSFRVGSLAELGDGKSYVFRRTADPAIRVEVLDRSGERKIEVVDDRPWPKPVAVGAP